MTGDITKKRGKEAENKGKETKKKNTPNFSKVLNSKKQNLRLNKKLYFLL